jgi:hypothetical protein
MNSDQIYKAYCDQLIEIKNLKKIINDTLRELPVGSISRHTPESIPERVGYWVRESAEECRLREQWQACADNLVDYAHEFVANLSTWGKGYDRYDKDIKQAEDAIEEYNRLKNTPINPDNTFTLESFFKDINNI